jgi:hypothetical protein
MADLIGGLEHCQQPPPIGTGYDLLHHMPIVTNRIMSIEILKIRKKDER